MRMGMMFGPGGKFPTQNQYRHSCLYHAGRAQSHLSIEYPGESDWVDVVRKSHAIGRALVVKILVAELNLSDCARRIRERRVQTVALEITNLR
jgi:hypothetical protein